MAATGGGKEEGAEGLAVAWGYACKKPRIGLTKLREILKGALAQCKGDESPEQVRKMLCATVGNWMEENDAMVEKVKTSLYKKTE